MCVCKCQKTTHTQELIFPSAMWILGVELKSSGLSATAFTCWVISLVFNQNSVSFLSLQQSSGEARLQLFSSLSSYASVHLGTACAHRRAPLLGWVWIRATIEDRLRGRRDVSKERGWDKKKDTGQKSASVLTQLLFPLMETNWPGQDTERAGPDKIKIHFGYWKALFTHRS